MDRIGVEMEWMAGDRASMAAKMEWIAADGEGQAG